MIHFESRDSIAIQFDNLFRLGNFYKFDFKRKLRCNYTQCIYHSFQPFRANQCKRFCSVCISHCKEKSRKSTDMIPMIMSKADHINRLEAPSFFFNCYLSALTTVNEQTAPIVSRHKCSQPSSRQRHHSSGSN